MRHVVTAAALFSLALPITVACARPQRVNANAQVLADFNQRVNAYAQLRDKAGDGATTEKTSEPAKIQAAEEALAGRIVALRAGAKRGDIFTPAVAQHFRRLLRPEIRSEDTKAAILDDNPGSVRFKINGKYPEDEPLSTVPPNVLAELPKLPPDLEYRFIGGYMILRDSRANLIIDYIANMVT